jgi:hypothetical protein
MCINQRDDAAEKAITQNMQKDISVFQCAINVKTQMSCHLAALK